MNIVFITVIAILGGFFIWGYRKGFVRIIFSFATMLITILAGTWITPYLFEYVKENTPLYEALTEKCSNELLKLSEETQMFPEVLQNTMYYFIEKSQLNEQIGAYVAEWILRGMVFFLSFFLISVFLNLLLHFLDVASKLPLIKGANRLFGGVIGISEGILIIWLGMFLITIFYSSQWGQTVLSQINDSKFLLFLYHHNGILLVFQFLTDW